ncbi:MAG: hypothetical protein RQ722_02915 [Desulfuromonadales bacterium]|nr:hypothetical protein [Desulfuromonadales bacterium]
MLSPLEAGGWRRRHPVGDIVVVDAKDHGKISFGIITSDDILEVVSEQLTSLIRAFDREHQIETERRS